MRSWTIFLVFGLIVLGIIIFTKISSISNTKNPIMQSAQQFLDAVNRNDANAVNALLDPERTKVLASGSNIISILFDDTQSILPTAFARQTELKWTYTEINAVKLDFNAKPVVINDIAKAPLTSGRCMYLRRIGDVWKIFYITKISVAAGSY